jgi:pyruvate ferredoxin oxidoreductase gamma subunit
MKTAARIVGTAAYLGGYRAQDSPMYGAERRGAAVTASTRFSDEPILERGQIDEPHLIVVADDTLLRDASAGVLRGQQVASVIFVNAQDMVRPPTEFRIRPTLITSDISGLTRRVLGRAAALSAGIAAAAARITGLISLDLLQQAAREELEELEVPRAEIDKNCDIVKQVFDSLTPAQLSIVTPSELKTLITAEYQSPLVGAPSILHAGNATWRQTGAWRIERPLVDRDACTRCGLCFVMCPDGAIQLDDEGYPVIDYDHCKGCMICQRLCPLHAIERQQETTAW